MSPSEKKPAIAQAVARPTPSTSVPIRMAALTTVSVFSQFTRPFVAASSAIFLPSDGSLAGTFALEWRAIWRGSRPRSSAVPPLRNSSRGRHGPGKRPLPPRHGGRIAPLRGRGGQGSARRGWQRPRGGAGHRRRHRRRLSAYESPRRRRLLAVPRAVWPRPLHRGLRLCRGARHAGALPGGRARFDSGARTARRAHGAGTGRWLGTSL